MLYARVSNWKIAEIELILKMYTQPIQYPGYSSLNNSIVLSPAHSHTRTHSTTRPQPPLTFQHQQSRAPSQKKLTLTCQNQAPFPKVLQRQPETTLKKRGAQCIYNKGKFVSLQVSRIAEPEVLTTKRENEPQYLTDLKRTFRDKIRELQSSYSLNLKEYSNQVRQLQVKLLSNTRELQAKEKKIKELQMVITQSSLKRKSNQDPEDTSYLSKKMGDLQVKVRVIASYLDDKVEKQNKDSLKIDVLTKNILAYFGSNFMNLKERTNMVMKTCFSRISELENQLELMRNKHEKYSEGTKGSTASICSSDCPNFYFPQSQTNASFLDDTFFYPNPRSQDCEFVLEMAYRRDQPLTCWLDQQDFLRYADTNSYLFNRRGDRIKLDKDQIKELIIQKVLVLA